MRIQHNIMAMNAYRNYNNNTSALSKNLEKLSSGYKINRAGDDAAGLAISEKMRAQITGLKAASKNVKDGVSLVKTAEGALQEVHTRVDGQPELAALRHRRAADTDELGVLGGDALKDGEGREGRELRRGVAVVGRDGDAFFKNALLHSCLRCAFSSVRGGSADAAPRGGGDAARSPRRRPS